MCIRDSLHLAAETEWPHVGPDFLDVGETLVLGPDLPCIIPAERAFFFSGFSRAALLTVDGVGEWATTTKVRWLHERTEADDLCLAGGVARLTASPTAGILREGPFARLFVPPAPGDAGACIGAAALAHVALTGRAPGSDLPHGFLGPEWTDDVG